MGSLGRNKSDNKGKIPYHRFPEYLVLGMQPIILVIVIACGAMLQAFLVGYIVNHVPRGIDSQSLECMSAKLLQSRLTRTMDPMGFSRQKY